MEYIFETPGPASNPLMGGWRDSFGLPGSVFTGEVADRTSADKRVSVATAVGESALTSVVIHK